MPSSYGRVGRRGFLAAGAGLAAVALARRFGGFGAAQPPGRLVSATDDPAGRHQVSGVDLRSGARFSVPVAQRCHEIVPDPVRADRAIVVARRPGTLLYELDVGRGAITREVASPADRHVYGHACFARDGALLYVPENDFARARGVIGVYDGSDLARLGEILSHGIGPHAIALAADGETLVVANGGIHTHPRHGRRPLNLDTMDPNLAWVAAATGRLRESVRLPDHRAGIRHLSLAADGSVAVAIQYEGVFGRTDSLLAYGGRSRGLRLASAPDDVQQALRAYAASVCLDARRGLAGITCPRGDLVAFFDVSSGELARTLSIRDAGGITLDATGRHFYISTGFGELHRLDADTLEPTAGSPVVFEDLRFDNHLVLL